MVSFGLPSFAQYAMFKLYEKDSPSIFSFAPDFPHLVRLFRDQTFGGITNVYMRHATTCDDDAAPAAKMNKSGMHIKIFLTVYHN